MDQKQYNRSIELMRKYANDQEFTELLALMLMRYEISGATDDRMKWFINEFSPGKDNLKREFISKK